MTKLVDGYDFRQKNIKRVHCQKRGIERLLLKYKNRLNILAEDVINNNNIAKEVYYNIKLNELTKENKENTQNLENIVKSYDLEMITNNILQALINSLNGDYIKAQEEFKKEVKNLK